MEIPVYTPDQVNLLPDQPGVYKYYNADRTLIYVGKAKSLKKRVSSYFTKSKNTNRKTVKMVREIRTIEFTIVNSEFDALLLENSLIKKNQPKYNILLKDDKSYPFILLTNERFPRVIPTRQRIPDAGTYFGPFASVKAMNNILDLLRNLYTLRTCRYDLSEENVKSKKYKVCLEYHIGNCLGPCEGLQTEESYNQDIQQATNILKGNMSIARTYFKDKMQQTAENLEFEEAQRFKDKLSLLTKYQAKSIVVNTHLGDTDVFTIVSDDQIAYINYLKANKGSIILTKTIEVKKKLDESNEDILALMIVELRERYLSATKEILANIEVPIELAGVTITVPKIGDKRKLVDLSIKNALYYKRERVNRVQEYQQRVSRVVLKLQEDLHLKQPPMHIECFDNSNLQGSNPVASMVCFKNGKPSKKDYRKFNIKTVVGSDDFASMYEIVFRRYKRLLEEDLEFPNLIVIDGGKGQLKAACQALKDVGVYGDIPIIGIAKRLEEIYTPGDPYPLHIDKKSESLKLIQRVRDEAHRFAITFHRKKRSNAALRSELEDIKGIGRKTALSLLKNFKSVKNIREAPEEDLAQLVGSSKAKTLKEALSK
ncbi:excinuclease ABC subunit UvrC [Tunicatimonas pelagia]|uniref:excinuclease ABC subunit UvrC n=1 Tax=Tunicatimonas pelagia TaxID=931531 RepID=UPI0026659380|nr:excinuclease ABC subunit UvrC [Tunicatimonas pelagia]WKN41822.1 excinuclease ABC subunit UvrC [Tunicatimonas pelagia]